MSIDWLPLSVFVLSVTFSPGPNTLMSAYAGMQYGYRGSLPFIFGVSSGFVLILCITALLASSLQHWLPQLQPLMALAASGYLLWLAAQVWGGRHQLGQLNQAPNTQQFRQGFVLQWLNPKVQIYGLLLFSTYLRELHSLPEILLSAMALSAVAFSSNSCWSLSGAWVRQYLRHVQVRLSVSVFLMLALIYTAADLILAQLG